MERVQLFEPGGARVELVVVGGQEVDVCGREGEAGDCGRGAEFAVRGAGGEDAGCGEAEDGEVEEVRQEEGREREVEVGFWGAGGAEGAGCQRGRAVG